MVRGPRAALRADVTRHDLAYDAQIMEKAVNRPIWLGVFPL